MELTKPKRTISKDNIKLIKATPCVVCLSKPSDPHHIKSRGSGGGDEMKNIMPLCRIHHTEVHKIGLRGFAIKHPTVEQALVSKDWYFDDISNKWVRDITP